MDVENRYIDINGVRTIFSVLKDKINLSKEELMGELKTYVGKWEDVEESVEEIKENLKNNYYTKIEVENRLPEELQEELIDKAFKNN